MYGGYSLSIGQKLLVTTVHLAALAAVTWYLLVSGLADGDPLRRVLLFLLSTVYFMRFTATMFVMLRRTIVWAEAMIVAGWVTVIHCTMAYFGGGQTSPAGAAAVVGLLLYACGSYVNTKSEHQRKLFKEHPFNRDKLYTGGLFRYSRHINYFGDVVLFSGFALVASSFWAFAVPAVMAAMFVLVSIPELDRYLARRYGQAFDRYAATTARFVPFVY